MKTDLHMHSFFSDGFDSPEDLVRASKSKGLEQIALTDHDTFAGVELFLDACDGFGLHGVAAIEMYFEPEQNFNGYRSEILGYFPTGEYKKTKQLIDYQIEKWDVYAQTSLDNAFQNKEIKQRFTTTDIRQILFANKHKQHVDKFSQIPISKKYVYEFLCSVNPLFKECKYKEFKDSFFKQDCFRNIEYPKKTAKQIIQAINCDHGLSVLAHPFVHKECFNAGGSVNEKFLDTLLETYKSYGLWGVEIHWYDGNREKHLNNMILSSIAENHGLRVTYGSDHHGFSTKRNNLGSFSGEMDCIRTN